MKQDKKTTLNGLSLQKQENHFAGMPNKETFLDGLWLEFEDSFIAILSGKEPVRKYYSDPEHRQEATC
jgi:hypothetical protein